MREIGTLHNKHGDKTHYKEKRLLISMAACRDKAQVATFKSLCGVKASTAHATPTIIGDRSKTESKESVTGGVQQT